MLLVQQALPDQAKFAQHTSPPQRMLLCPTLFAHSPPPTGLVSISMMMSLTGWPLQLICLQKRKILQFILPGQVQDGLDSILIIGKIHAKN